MAAARDAVVNAQLGAAGVEAGVDVELVSGEEGGVNADSDVGRGGGMNAELVAGGEGRGRTRI